MSSSIANVNPEFEQKAGEVVRRTADKLSEENISVRDYKSGTLVRTLDDLWM